MIVSGKGRNFYAPRRERREVTVCIAAPCKDGDKSKIVLCTDWRISGTLGSAEIKLKQRKLTSGWFLLTAGEDADINAVQNLLIANFSRAKSADKLDETNVPGLVREALAQRKKDKIDEFIRGQYGLSYDDFLALGKDKLPPDVFRDAMYAVRDIPVEAEFIVAGFTFGYPFLVQTEGASKVHIRELFAVAGEGGYLAQTVLLHRGQMDVHSLERTLYCVYEAKRYAEGVNSVGSATSIQILHSDGTAEYVRAPGIELLKAKYEKLGPQPISGQLEPLPKEVLKVYEA